MTKKIKTAAICKSGQVVGNILQISRTILFFRPVKLIANHQSSFKITS